MTLATTTIVTVARGRSIQVGNQLFGPGEEAVIPIEDLEHMTASGFVHDPNGAVVVTTPMRPEQNSGKIGLQHTIEIEANRPGFIYE